MQNGESRGLRKLGEDLLNKQVPIIHINGIPVTPSLAGDFNSLIIHIDGLIKRFPLVCISA